jgi:hypothetical protein
LSVDLCCDSAVESIYHAIVVIGCCAIIAI